LQIEVTFFREAIMALLLNWGTVYVYLLLTISYYTLPALYKQSGG